MGCEQGRRGRALIFFPGRGLHSTLTFFTFTMQNEAVACSEGGRVLSAR